MELELQKKRTDYISIGPHLEVDKIAESLSLHSLLDTIFSGKSNKILDIATYMIMSENNVMQYIEDYGFHHLLFNGMNFTASTISKKSEDIYIAYDSSNMNTREGYQRID